MTPAAHPSPELATPGACRMAALRSLAPYVCPLVRDRLVREGARLPLPCGETFPAVVLRTDISGFTALTETLHAKGASGVEELSRLLDAYFTELIGLVTGHGGVVVKFAGDALLAVWRGRDPAECIALAIQCARAIQARLGGYAVGSTGVMAMRIGLGSGEASHFVLGGVGERWLSSLCGSPVARANRAVALAQAGEILACSNVAQLAPGEPRAEGFVRLETNGESAPVSVGGVVPIGDALLPALLPHVSSAIRDRLAAGQMAWLAEFRRVSILFIHVGDADDEPSRSDRHAVVRMLQEGIARFEGTVDALDDERAGVTLVAAFGLPPLAHEDDAGRAVRTALAVQRDFRAQARVCSIGIASGEIFCGSIGSDARRTYGMIGNAVNRCARLMELAVDEILCDEATVWEASRQISFEPARQVTLRGVSHPIKIHRPLGEHARRPLEISGVVGRTRERLEIEARLARLCRGERAGPVLIEGEAGLGKSTLLSAMVARAAGSGLLTFFGGAESGDLTRSYAAWPGIFQALFGFRPEDETRVERAAAVLAGLGSHLDLPPLAPIFNPVLALELPENEATSRLTAQSRAEIIADTLVRLLQRAAASRPLVLALDDCQWLNPASWELVASVLDRVPEAFCVLATRPLGPQPPEPWQQARKVPDACLLQLGRLPAEDVDALICRRFGVASIPAALAHFIAGRADGHPLFAESLAFALRDAGHVVIENGSCRLPPNAGSLEELHFPATMQGVIRARIDRLSPPEQLTIKVASVMGRAFSPSALAAIHPVEADRARIPQMLQRLAAAELIEMGPGVSGQPCSFAHAIIEETAYEMMLFAQRRDLHARFARWLEREEAADYPTLAHHWAMADENDKTIEYAEKAGEQAFQRFANREAAHFIEQALARSPLPETEEARHRHAHWHLQLGEAHFHLGVLDSSQAHLHRAVELFGFHPPPRNVLAPAGLPAAVGRQTWNRFSHRLRSPQPRASSAALAGAIRAFNMLGEMAFFRSDLPRATYCCIHGLNLAERLQAPAKLAEMFAATMIVAAALPFRAPGRLYLRIAQETIERAEDPVASAYVHYLSGVYLTGLAEWPRCDAMLGVAHREFLRFGDSRRLDECRCTMIYSRMHRGEFDHAGRLVAEMVESSDRRRDAQTSGWSRTMRAQHALPTAGAEAALAVLGGDPSVAIDMLTTMSYHAVSAAALCRRRCDAEARAACAEAFRLVSLAPPVSAHMVISATFVAEAASLLWENARDPDERRALGEMARRACRTLRAYARVFPVARPQALLWTGAGDILSGHRARGLARLNEALAEAGRLAMPHDAACVHLHRARLSPAGRERDADLDRAAQLFHEAGTHADAARAEACRGAR